MSQTTIESLALGYGVLTVVWGSVAAALLRLFVGRGLRPPAWQLLIAVTVGLGAFSALQGVLVLVPMEVRHVHAVWVTTAYLTGDVLIVLIVTAWRHKVVALTFGHPPGQRWLATHWGACLAMVGWACVLAIRCDVQGILVTLYRIVLPLYVGATLAGSLAQMAGGLRRGAWRPGALGALHPADVVAVGWVVLATIVFAGFQLDGGWATHPLLLTVLLISMNAAVAVPIVVRLLADVVRDVSLVLVVCGVAGLTLAGVDRVLAPVRDGLAPDVASAAVVVAMVAVVLPAFLAARAAFARLLPRGRPERQAALEQFLHELSPELGVEACGRRALARLVQVLELRGAALRLADGTLLVEGAIRFEPLAAAWADVDEARRPQRPLLGWYEVQELPFELRAAIADTDVVGVIPVASPRCRWGDLFLSSGLLGATFAGDVIRVLEAYARQLGQLLDGAALLSRTVGVERSLAHAEKLAAIGETTARIAHEIRNPLAAARSLAQQLVREPTPFGEELEVILEELERVERRMAGLLRLARREEIRAERIDLSALVETMGAAVGERLAAGGIRLRLDVARGVHACVDRERLQQVLENLVHNAEDALDGHDGPRDLVIALGNGGGRAMLRVSDSGGGVPAATLPRLFEPFFSTKPKGTGLGLAIVRGIVEAHGGHIRALAAEGAGLTFEIELPLEGPEAA